MVSHSLFAYLFIGDSHGMIHIQQDGGLIELALSRKTFTTASDNSTLAVKDGLKTNVSNESMWLYGVCDRT